MNKYALCLITMISFSASYSMQSFKEYDMQQRHLADIKRDFIKADNKFEQQMRTVSNDYERNKIEQARTDSRKMYEQKYREALYGSSSQQDNDGYGCYVQ